MGDEPRKVVSRKPRRPKRGRKIYDSDWLERVRREIALDVYREVGLRMLDMVDKQATPADLLRRVIDLLAKEGLT